MSKRTSRLGLWMVVGLVLAGGAVAQAVLKDSATFPYKFEGDTTSPTGYTQAGGYGSITSDGNVFTYVTTAGQWGLWRVDWNANNVSQATGFTIEFQIKVDNATTTGPDGVLGLFAGDGTDVCNVLLLADGFKVQNDWTWVTLSTASNTDGFHTFRIVHDGSSNVFQYYRDGVQIGTNVPRSGYSGNGYNYMYWGVGSSSVYGRFDLDYIRWATPQKVQGVVTLGDYTGDKRMVGVQVDFRTPGTQTVLRTDWSLLDANGALTILDVPSGTYDVAVKACSWLAQVKTGVVVGDGTTDLGPFNLVGGDNDGSNAVDSTDLSIVLANME